MRLVVDTSVLVGELLRTTGRQRLGDSRLELFQPEQMWAETRIELPRRIERFCAKRGLAESIRVDLEAMSFEAVQSNVTVLDHAVYAAVEDEARARSLRDPDDWALVASAMVLSADIWTNDQDLLGTGIATWTTETLRLWLDRHPAG